MSPAIFIPILLAIIEHAPELQQGLRDAAGAIRALWERGEDPTPAELDAVMRHALAAGVDLRSVVEARLAPGGDWHGRGDLPPGGEA